MNAEINLNEPFGYEIFQTVVRYDLRVNLEIGSWDGAGSTTCIAAGMDYLSGNKRLDCIEIVKEKFDVLQRRFANNPFVNCFHGSSIAIDQLLDDDFDKIWNSPYNRIPQSLYNKELVNSWYTRDVETIKNSPAFLALPGDLVYDSVLIDGSEFTGFSEFSLLKARARILFLDDVHHAFKCNQVYYTLLADTRWTLIKERADIRNGFAIFARNDYGPLLS